MVLSFGLTVQGDVNSFDADARGALELVLSQQLDCKPPGCYLMILSVTPASVALRVQMTVPDDPSALPGGGSSAADSDATASTVARRTRTLLSQTPAQLSTALSVGVQGVALLSVQAGLTVPLVLSQAPASPAPLDGGGPGGGTGGGAGGGAGGASDLKASEGTGMSVTTIIAAGAGGGGGVLLLLLLVCCYRRRCYRSAVPRAQIASPTTFDRGRRPKGKSGQRDRWPAQGGLQMQQSTTAEPMALAQTTSHAWPNSAPAAVATISSTMDDSAILQQKVAKAQAADNLLGQLIIGMPPASANLGHLPYTSQIEDSTPRSGDQSPSSSSSRSQATPRTPREDSARRDKFIDRSRRSASGMSPRNSSGASSPSVSPTPVLPTAVAAATAAVPPAATFTAVAEEPPTPRLEGEGNFDWANYGAEDPAPVGAIGTDVFLPDDLYDDDETAVYV